MKYDEFADTAIKKIKELIEKYDLDEEFADANKRIEDRLRQTCDETIGLMRERLVHYTKGTASADPNLAKTFFFESLRLSEELVNKCWEVANTCRKIHLITRLDGKDLVEIINLAKQYGEIREEQTKKDFAKILFN